MSHACTRVGSTCDVARPRDRGARPPRARTALELTWSRDIRVDRVHLTPYNRPHPVRVTSDLSPVINSKRGLSHDPKWPPPTPRVSGPKARSPARRFPPEVATPDMPVSPAAGRMARPSPHRSADRHQAWCRFRWSTTGGREAQGRERKILLRRRYQTGYADGN